MMQCSKYSIWSNGLNQVLKGHENDIQLYKKIEIRSDSRKYINMPLRSKCSIFHDIFKTNIFWKIFEKLNYLQK